MGLIKLLLSIGIWILIHYSCENFPFDTMKKYKESDLTPYDYFHVYGLIWLLGISVVFLICL